MNRVLHTRRLLLAGAMFLGPVGVMVGLGLQPAPHSNDATKTVNDIVAHHTQFVIAGFTLAIGALLFAFGTAGLARLAPARGGTLTTIGSILAAIGAVSGAIGGTTFTVAIGMLTPEHAALAVQAQNVAEHSGLVSATFMPFLALPVGLVLTGIGLLRARVRPPWLPILLIVSVVPLALVNGVGLVAVLANLPFTVAVAGLGLVLIRTDDTTSQEPNHPAPEVALR